MEGGEGRREGEIRRCGVWKKGEREGEGRLGKEGRREGGREVGERGKEKGREGGREGGEREGEIWRGREVEMWRGEGVGGVGRSESEVRAERKGG